MTGKRMVKRGGMIGAILLLPLLLTACGATSARQAHPVIVEPATAMVPDVEGLQLSEARRTLRHGGFQLGRIEEQRDRQVHAGTVLRQYPGPRAAAAAGRPVDLVVAAPRQAAPVGVPDVTGRPLDEAKRALRQAGLRLGTVQERKSGRARDGMVLRQDPAPWVRVAPGERVDLLLARADRRYGDDDGRDDDDGKRQDGRADRDGNSQRVQVPDVTGLTLGKAQQRLSAAKLRIGRVTKQVSADARAGTILAQSPKAGPRKAGDRIDLVLAEAAPRAQPKPNKPEPGKAELREVPSLTGLSVEVAAGRLRQAGLRLGAVIIARSGGPAGQVVRQGEAPGERVARGTQVSVVVVEPRDQ